MITTYCAYWQAEQGLTKSYVLAEKNRSQANEQFDNHIQYWWTDLHLLLLIVISLFHSEE